MASIFTWNGSDLVIRPSNSNKDSVILSKDHLRLFVPQSYKYVPLYLHGATDTQSAADKMSLGNSSDDERVCPPTGFKRNNPRCVDES